MGLYAAASPPLREKVTATLSRPQRQTHMPPECGSVSVEKRGAWRGTRAQGGRSLLAEDDLLRATCFQSTVAELQQRLQQENKLLDHYEAALHAFGRQTGQANVASVKNSRRAGCRRTGGQQVSLQQEQKGRVKSPARTPQQLKRVDRQQCLQYSQHARPQRRREVEAEDVVNSLSSSELLLQELETAESDAAEAIAREDEMLNEHLMLQQRTGTLWLLLAQQQRERLLDEDETSAVQRQLRYVEGHLQKLKRVSVINDAFYIVVQDGFPSINTCRIGRVPFGDDRRTSNPPSWEEINMGWGHLCFLLDVLFRRLYVHPRHYRLVPRGPSSCLLRKGDGVVLPLQGGGGETALGRLFFSSHRFDAATAAFVECVQEFFEALTHFCRQPWPPYSTSVVRPLAPPELPFPIEGDRVGGLSIRTQCSQDEAWTKAVKYLLLDMKWLLAYTEKVCTTTPNAGEFSGERIEFFDCTQAATSSTRHLPAP